MSRTPSSIAHLLSDEGSNQSAIAIESPVDKKPKRVRQFKHTPLLKRGRKACLYCKEHKWKCVGAEDDGEGGSCLRCIKKNLPCEFASSPRRTSRTPQTRPVQLEEIVQEDEEPTPAASTSSLPTPKYYNLSLPHSLNPTQVVSGPNTTSLPPDIPPIDPNNPSQSLHPRLLSLITREQVKDLFEIWWDKFYPVGQFFDPAPPAYPQSLLLTATVCAITSTHYTKSTHLHDKLVSFALEILSEVIITGQKSLQIVFALNKMSEYPLRPDRSLRMGHAWSILGMSIRMTMELDLPAQPCSLDLGEEASEEDHRNALNRERLWIGVYSFDRAYSILLGRPTITQEDALIRRVTQPVWSLNKSCKPTDPGLGHYALLQRIMGRVIDTLCWYQPTTASGLVPGLNYNMVLKAAQIQLEEWIETFPMAVNNNNHPRTNSPPGVRPLPQFEGHTGHLIGPAGYLSLPWASKLDYFLNSLKLSTFGLQNAIENEPLDVPTYFSQVQTTATGALTVIRDTSALYDWLPYASETRLVMVVYCAVCLLKLINPNFRRLHTDLHNTWRLLHDIADLLIKSGVNDQHLPRLYGKRLEDMLAEKVDDYEAVLNGRRVVVDGTRSSQAWDHGLLTPTHILHNQF